MSGNSPAGGNNDEPTVSGWLKKYAIPFDTTSPASDYTDLMPLKKMVGDARIVALGEATHGTREFFQMKHRILKFLVNEMGFNTFAIEDSFPDSFPLNRYVQTGEGDPATLLAYHCFRIWETQEVLDMILWMREHNQNPGNAPKVSFYGFDMQAPQAAIKNVIEYLQKVDPAFAKQAVSLYSDFLSYRKGLRKYHTLSGRIKKKCRRNLQKVYFLLKARRKFYEKRAAPEEFTLALQNARLVVQGEAVYSVAFNLSGRDSYMAENIRWLTEYAGPDAKIVLWAHNSHVSYNALGKLSMGYHLKGHFKKEMVSIGFGFHRGSFNAYSLLGKGKAPGKITDHRALPAISGSYGHYFQRSQMPRFILDLRCCDFESKGPKWIIGPRSLRNIEAIYNHRRPLDSFRKIRLPESFDVFIFIEETTPSVLLTRSPEMILNIKNYIKKYEKILTFEELKKCKCLVLFVPHCGQCFQN